MRAEDFIVNGCLPDIEYRTNVPEEIVCPRVTQRDGVPVVYLHNERDAAHKGFVPVVEFLCRLARREPNLACTGYRANGRQTTISFNKEDRVTLSPRLQVWLSTLAAPREGKSAAVVGFLANLMPLYTPEDRDGVWCARSLQDGTLILPVDESDWDEQRGTVRVHWQGDAGRGSEVDGSHIVSLALVRYVELLCFGRPAKELAATLQDLARHFEFKTGCSLELGCERPSPVLVDAVSKAVGRVGESAVANLLLRAAGI